jgi:hypothetical protein
MASSVGLVILLGIASTTQTHLAKALERQGIETFDLIRARLQQSREKEAGASALDQVAGTRRKPLIYTIGLVLNHTTFLYHLLVAPLGGTTALYTSMYGMGLIALLAYSTRVMKERMNHRELMGALAILAGTLVIGIEGIFRPPLNMAWLPLGDTVIAVLLLLVGGLGLIVAGVRNGSPQVIGLVFGLGAGLCGSLDPFLKGVGQTAGGGGQITPQTTAGWAVLASSFIIGWIAFLVTQWGFYRRARANILVPAYNCSYIAVPVVLQAALLPGYVLYWSTAVGLGLIMAGFVLMRAFRPSTRAEVSAADTVAQEPERNPQSPISSTQQGEK